MEVRATRGDIDATQFSAWYDVLRTDSIKSVVIPVPEAFLTYLRQDGIKLPSTVDNIREGDLSDHESDGESVGSDSEDIPVFGDIEDAIRRAITSLGGEVFVKTNWSAPLDATWVTVGSMKCNSIRDVYLQLKSSDRTNFDMDHMYDLCGDNGDKTPSVFTIVVRKWANLFPSMEFRLFVRSGSLIGICQRDCCTYYPFLAGKISSIAERLAQFYETNIRGQDLPANYCMDVYIDKKDRVWVIDVNAFGNPSCPLLFEWQELLDSEACVVKFVESEASKLKSVLGMKRGPVDIHLSPDFSNFMNICRQQQAEDDDDDSSNADS